MSNGDGELEASRYAFMSAEQPLPGVCWPSQRRRTAAFGRSGSSGAEARTGQIRLLRPVPQNVTRCGANQQRGAASGEPPRLLRRLLRLRMEPT